MAAMALAVSLLETLSGVSQYFVSLPLHPVFNIAHFILTAFALRNEPGGVEFSRDHPIASCVMTFLVAASGGLLANLSLGQPPVESVVDPTVVATCVLAWYLIFFSPLDSFYRLCHFMPFSLTLWVVKELSRAKKVYSGVMMASALYPGSVLPMAIVGMFKGSGKQWGITWYHLVFSPQCAHKLELLGISYTTKSSLALGLLLAYNHTHSLLDPAPLVLLGGCVFVGFKLWSLQAGSIDPFLTSQSMFWNLLTCLSATGPQGRVEGVAGSRSGDGGVDERSESSSHSSTTATTERTEVDNESVHHLKHD